MSRENIKIFSEKKYIFFLNLVSSKEVLILEKMGNPLLYGKGSAGKKT